MKKKFSIPKVFNKNPIFKRKAGKHFIGRQYEYQNI